MGMTYRMTKKMYDELLKEFCGNPRAVVKYVNKTYGLTSTVVDVVTY